MFCQKALSVCYWSIGTLVAYHNPTWKAQSYFWSLLSTVYLSSVMLKIVRVLCIHVYVILYSLPFIRFMKVSTFKAPETLPCWNLFILVCNLVFILLAKCFVFSLSEVFLFFNDVVSVPNLLSLQLIFVGSFYLSVFICALALLTHFYISVFMYITISWSYGHMDTNYSHLICSAQGCI